MQGYLFTNIRPRIEKNFNFVFIFCRLYRSTHLYETAMPKDRSEFIILRRYPTSACYERQ